MKPYYGTNPFLDLGNDVLNNIVNTVLFPHWVILANKSLKDKQSPIDFSYIDGVVPKISASGEGLFKESKGFVNCDHTSWVQGLPRFEDLYMSVFNDLSTNTPPSCTTPPDKVTGLTCSYDKSTKKMYTSWNAPNSCCAITKYIIYINSDGGSWYTYEHTSTSRTFTMQGDARFCVKVKAVNCNGEGAFSDESCCGEKPQPPKCKPSKPGTPKGQTDYSKKTLTFNWTASTVQSGCCAVKTYKWKYTLNGKRYGDEFDTQGNTSFYWGRLSSAANGTYCVQVKAVDCNGNESDWSEIGCCDYQLPKSKPSAPTGLSVTIKDGKPYLSWSAPSSDGGSPITKYYIWRGTSSGSYSDKLGGWPQDNFHNTKASKGVKYYYVVVAVNAIGESSYSNEVSIKVP